MWLSPIIIIIQIRIFLLNTSWQKKNAQELSKSNIDINIIDIIILLFRFRLTEPLDRYEEQKGRPSVVINAERNAKTPTQKKTNDINIQNSNTRTQDYP